MAKLKANKVKKIICPTCKGNGFVKVASLEHESMVHVLVMQLVNK